MISVEAAKILKYACRFPFYLSFINFESAKCVGEGQVQKELVLFSGIGTQEEIRLPICITKPYNNINLPLPANLPKM
jgi:hypothetical protein